MTPSLTNFLLSLVAGAVIIIIPATIFLVFVSQRDQISRRG
ncbi:MAG: photosystem II reaction center X protein [Cyanobacteria bacterium J06632_22]